MSETKDNSDITEVTNVTSETKSTMDTQCTSKKKIPCIIVIGMAGSGKTTFVQRLVSVLYNCGKPYVINLDPACRTVPYPANIGIYYMCSIHSIGIYTY